MHASSSSLKFDNETAGVLIAVSVLIAVILLCVNTCRNLIHRDAQGNTARHVTVIVDPTHLVWPVTAFDPNNNNINCLICFEPADDPCVFNRHDFPEMCQCSKENMVYCRTCLLQWVEKTPQCPVCRVSGQ